MGARPSTPRTVQLDNDIPIGVIDVSDDVVQRLKGLHAEGHFSFFQTKFCVNLNRNHLRFSDIVFFWFYVTTNRMTYVTEIDFNFII